MTCLLGYTRFLREVKKKKVPIPDEYQNTSQEIEVSKADSLPCFQMKRVVQEMTLTGK